MGYGLLTLRPDECVIMNDVPPVEGGVVATIGAGTGLGECFLTKVQYGVCLFYLSQPSTALGECFLTEVNE